MSTSKWVGSWSVSPVEFTSAPIYFNNQTLRARIKLSIGGTKIRLKFSNRFGHQPIFLSGVSVALEKDSDIAEGTNRSVTFHGESAITIQPEQEVIFSDEIALTAADLSTISISLFFSEKTSITTVYVGILKNLASFYQSMIQVIICIQASRVLKQWQISSI